MTRFNQDKEDEEIEKLLSGKSEKQLAKEEKKDSLAQEKPKKLELMLADREYRVKRLTGSSAAFGDHILSKDGRKLYYISPLESGQGLCVKDLREGSVKVLARGVTGRITPSADGNEIYALLYSLSELVNQLSYRPFPRLILLVELKPQHYQQRLS